MIIKSNFVCVRRMAGVCFIPGTNQITPAQEIALKKEPVFKLDIEQKMLEIVSRSKLDLSEMETSAAVKVVKEMLSREDLDDIIASDKRQTVIQTAKEQLSKIKAVKA